MLDFHFLVIVFFTLSSAIAADSDNIEPESGDPLTRSIAASKCQRGSCQSIFKCEKLYALYKKSHSLSKAEISYLQGFGCGHTGGAPYVCCDDANSSKSKPNSSAESDKLTSRITSSSKCGTSVVNNTEKIAGGKPALLGNVLGDILGDISGAWPWMTALYVSRSGAPKRFLCGGSLISDEWVVTAAHCVPGVNAKDKLTHVRLGDLDIDDNVDDKAPFIEVEIKDIIKHPKYVNSPPENDIALLRLSRQVVFTPHVQPICVMNGKEYESDAFYNRKKPTVIGWGTKGYLEVTSTQLLEVDVPVVNITKCNDHYTVKRAKIDSRVICAGMFGKDSCQGDSGGPLMFQNASTGLWYLIGVVSFGFECARENYPGVYTKAAYFADWIRETSKVNL